MVEAREGSDLWRTTSYGFVRDTGHALLSPFPDGTGVEVTFGLDLERQFDQAGLLVRVDERNWVKAGVEVVDGIPQVGAVVTREVSDWSAAPVPGWRGRKVTVRASRSGDALTVRARVGDQEWQLVRVCPVPVGAADTGAGTTSGTGEVLAGPYCCAPERAGLTVRFTSFVHTAADTGLH